MVDLTRESYVLSLDEMAECWEMAGRELDEFLGTDINYLRYTGAVEKTRIYDLNKIVITS